MDVIGNGSIVNRDGRPRSRCRTWNLQIWVDVDGKRKRRSRTFHGTYTQAQDALRGFVDELRGQQVTADALLSDYMNAWHARREASGAYSQRTMRTDREKLAPVRELLGGRAISSVTPEDVRRVYEEAMKGGTPSGRKWSPDTVHRMHTALSKLFADAVDDGLLERSPIDRVTPPKASRVSGGKAMPPADMDTLLASLDYSSGPQRAVALALGCGLRRSECCGLEWSDIRDGCILVSKSLGDDGEPKPTKTGKSRTVPMPRTVSRAMEANRSAGPVVGVLPQALTHWWTRHRDALGCGDYRFHDLRHSYATRLAASGVHMRVAMELCGWSSVEMAARVYTHVSNDMQRDAVRAAFGDFEHNSSIHREGKEKGQG